MKRILVSLVGALLILPNLLSAQYTPPAASVSTLSEINFANWLPVDESYRSEFDRCDSENIFRNVRMTRFRLCSTDPNRVKALLKFRDGTIFFESKLGLDIDGSWKACHNPGLADLCPTSFTWDGLTAPNRYVDSDKYPYVVIPVRGLRRSDPEFRNKTGINMGDLGVVVYRDKIVPVFVADGGPHNKLGEGSAALFKAIGEDRCRSWTADGHCQDYRDFSIGRGVLFFLFPNSRIRGITPNNALEKIRNEALARFEQLKQR